MASYRYRCMTPAAEMGARINDPSADVLIFTKPNEQDIPWAIKAKSEGRLVIADFCDMHFRMDAYKTMLDYADGVTCPTQWFADFLREDFGKDATVVPDPYEFPQMLPHCAGDNLLWFGHATNIDSLQRVFASIADMPLSVVSNIDGATAYSRENILSEFSRADFVLMPATAPYKSANRTIEAIRQGCFVVAEPHPAINDFPIYLGNIRKGIQWAQQNRASANRMISEAQDFVQKRYSPQIQASAWRTAIRKAQYSCTLEAAALSGADG